MNLNVESWEPFRLDEIFEVKKGKRLTSEDQTEGRTPLIPIMVLLTTLVRHRSIKEIQFR